MMKRILFAILVAAVFVSCDKVEPPYVENGGNTPSNDTGNTEKIVKKVLVEDYTAHLCNNCPAAHRELQTLQGVYGEQIVPVGIHVGSLAAPLTATYFGEDFRTQTGNDLNDFFGADAAGLPVGMVNRREFNGNRLLPYSEWGSAVQQLLSEPQTLNIVTDVVYNNVSHSIDVTATTTVINAFQPGGNLKICLYLAEDSIIGWQKDAENESGEDVQDYIHRHVLRGALNGTWGQLISLDPSVAGDTAVINVNSFSVDTAYNINQCYIISFVYDDNSLEIYQADEVKVINN